MIVTGFVYPCAVSKCVEFDQVVKKVAGKLRMEERSIYWKKKKKLQLHMSKHPLMIEIQGDLNLKLNASTHSNMLIMTMLTFWCLAGTIFTM